MEGHMPSSDFAGKTVVVTGAARGLGAAFAVVLADRGANVIMAARNNESLSTLAESIRLRSGSRPETVVFDLADPSQTTLAAKKLRDEKPKIDILINNAAQWLPGRMDEHDAYAIVGTISSTVIGTLLFTRGLLKPLEASGAGDILNIISISGIANTPLGGASVAFHAAKHGQTGLTDGLRQELRGRPIRVSAIYPPLIDDVSPLDEEAWAAKRGNNSRIGNRDVIEAALFALTRPRHVTLASIVIDSEDGGLLPR